MSRFSTSSRVMVLLLPQLWVAQRVDAEVNQQQAAGKGGQGQAGCYQPGPLAGEECASVVGPVQHHAPADRVRVTDTQELQAGFRPDRAHSCDDVAEYHQ